MIPIAIKVCITFEPNENSKMQFSRLMIAVVCTRVEVLDVEGRKAVGAQYAGEGWSSYGKRQRTGRQHDESAQEWTNG
jgi:hypothetical protein